MEHELTDEKIKELSTRFEYHEPKGTQITRYKEIRSTLLAVAMGLCQNCPECRELSLALMHLELAGFYANASIARREK